MKELLLNIMEQSGSLSVEEIVLHIAVSALLSLAIFLSYRYTHSGTAYSRKFNVSLVTLTVLTATVMTVIGNNIALSLGMVGALSIVRFRHGHQGRPRHHLHFLGHHLQASAAASGEYHGGSRRQRRGVPRPAALGPRPQRRAAPCSSSALGARRSWPSRALSSSTSTKRRC